MHQGDRQTTGKSAQACLYKSNVAARSDRVCLDRPAAGTISTQEAQLLHHTASLCVHRQRLAYFPKFQVFMAVITNFIILRTTVYGVTSENRVIFMLLALRCKFRHYTASLTNGRVFKWFSPRYFSGEHSVLCLYSSDFLRLNKGPLNDVGR